MYTRRFIVSSLLAVLAASTAFAAEMPAPSGEVVLTVTGNVSNTNAGGGMQFDMAMIQALPAVTVETASPWTEGVAKFEGVALKDILAAAGASGTRISAIALNDYAAELPMSDALEMGAFVAYRMNGAEMSVRERGPLWILYPFDSKPELRAEEYYSRAVWQLKALDVKP